VRFKCTLDSLLVNNSLVKAWQVARRGVPGTVVIDDYSVAESLLSDKSSPSFACSSSRKSASSLSIKLDSAPSASTKPVSPSKKAASSLSRKPALKLDTATQNHVGKITAMSATTRLLAAQKDKPKSERLDSTKVVDIIIEGFKSTLDYLTIR
jgi:hypothetical protein